MPGDGVTDVSLIATVGDRTLADAFDSDDDAPQSPPSALPPLKAVSSGPPPLDAIAAALAKDERGARLPSPVSPLEYTPSNGSASASSAPCSSRQPPEAAAPGPAAAREDEEDGETPGRELNVEEEQCPLCMNTFPAFMLEDHASACIIAATSPPEGKGKGKEQYVYQAMFEDLVADGSMRSPSAPPAGTDQADDDDEAAEVGGFRTDFGYCGGCGGFAGPSGSGGCAHAPAEADEDELWRERERQLHAEEAERLFQEFMQQEHEQEEKLAEERRRASEAVPHCDLCHLPLSFELVPDGSLLDSVYLENCTHVFCRTCIQQHVRSVARLGPSPNPGAHGGVCCPIPTCRRQVAAVDLQALLSAQEYDHLLSSELQQLVSASPAQFVKCPQCSFIIERDRAPELSRHELEANPARLVVEGQQLTFEAFRHHQEYRFRCRACSTEFCGQCQESPYHFGKTCEQFRHYRVSRRCRFCDAPVELANSRKRKSCGGDVCFLPECEQRGGDVCPKTLACGHQCCGLRGERQCLPCLEEGCPKRYEAQCGSDYCTICFCEGLAQAPCVRLDCGHVFHFHCVKKKLQQKWPGARITFGFMNCPTCGQEMKHPALSKELKELNRFRDDVRRRAALRLSHDGLDKSSALTDKTSKYYNKPLLYAADMLCYYQCFKCQKPYFGGMKRCEDMADDDEEGRKFDPAELVCSACVPNKDLKVCKIHGTDFIEYKCKFCCSIAQWFCWGTTHFCTNCHKLQEKGEYVTKKKKEELPKCDGRKRCPLKIDHPPNGSEFALGCAVCRRSHSEGF